MKTIEVINILSQFSGSDSFYQMNNKQEFFITEGCYFLRDKCNLGWLFDLIISYQERLVNHDFQVWEFKLQGGYCTLKCTDGNDHLLFAQEIENCILPLPALTLWVIDQVCLLPSEY